MIYMLEKSPLRAHHILFPLALMCLALIALFYAFLSSGPIVLGTEMNTNGHVEYLCLGRACEDLPKFSWVD